MDRIRQTKAFLLEQLQGSGMEEIRWRYRYEHTLRVAAIGQAIAVQEGFDRETMALACLLHDVGYVLCKTQEEYEHHGKLSAQVARPFLQKLGLDAGRLETVCYAIMVHTEEERDYPRPCTPLEASVADADNIDRFDALRMADTVTYYDFMKKRPREILDIAVAQIARYEQYLDLPFATHTATALWRDRLGFQLEYYRRLKAQMELCADEALR